MASQLRLGGIALLLCIGCSSEQPRVEPKDQGVAKKAEAKNQFLIASTDFGIQADKSKVDVKKGRDGNLLLTVEVNGSSAIAKQLGADKTSRWLYIPDAPMFYVHGYALSEMPGDGPMTIKLAPTKDDRYELAIYLYEHHLLKNVVLELRKDRVEISGTVDIDGKYESVHICWIK